MILMDDSTFVDEKLILEDGAKILLEESACLLRMEEREQDLVKGDYGDPFCFEDGDQMRLESETTIEEDAYFSTERSIELTNKYIHIEGYIENGRTLMEDGSFLVDEESSENGITSFVPFGLTFDSINMISSQQAYDISYYLKHEDGSAHNSGTHGDNITMEDGQPPLVSGNANPLYNGVGVDGLVNEVSKAEGLRIYDLNDTYPNTFVSDLPKHERKTTNIAYSAYVKSA
jgi:hypothetical protein